MTSARPGANPLLARLRPADEAAMRDLIGGALRTQAVYTVVKLGVPEHLALARLTAVDLAARVNGDADALRRVMRFLVTCGVFEEDGDGRFGLTPSGEYLQAGHPRSLRPSALRAGEGFWQTAGALIECVRTGATAHLSAHGREFFDRIAGEAKEMEFAARMSGSTAGIAEAVGSLEVVRNARTIVDVGGGHGAVLLALLADLPEARGVLFDTAATIESARAFVASHPAGSRCELVPGDFFHGVPEGDVYLLSWILHDWDDARASSILRACRASGGPDSALVVAEVELPAHAAARAPSEERLLADPFLLDLQMLLLTGGRERTRSEYEALLRESGFTLREVLRVSSARGVSLFVGAGRPGQER